MVILEEKTVPFKIKLEAGDKNLLYIILVNNTVYINFC